MAALDCAENMLFLIPILHQTTTLVMMAVLQMALFLIPILHQTTTVTSIYLLSLVLFLIPILHQTTTRRLRSGPPIGCFSFQFYIKPQPMQRLFKCFRVVSHSNSTSNHNYQSIRKCHSTVVSHSNSTSNHNYIASIVATA